MTSFQIDATTFARRFDVSRETVERLERYVAILVEWNARINLISAGTIPQIWERHVADSFQISGLAPEDWLSWLDLGSGGGFPGLVVAASISGESRKSLRLVESDARKVAFLNAAIRQTGVPATAIRSRIEALPSLRSDVISARALAPISKLLGYAERHTHSRSICLFHKGRTVHKEIEEAQGEWRFSHRLHQSVTSSDSFIVEIGAFERA